ncbi:hypothetical protein J4G37_41850, partial [Microvirga sp. 3-52]|nr:hypothetical protein [Microvirga sp. 3-52]
MTEEKNVATKEMPKEKNTNLPQRTVSRPKQSNFIFYADADDVNMIDSKDDYDYINIKKDEQRKQSMKGFNPEYNNIVDYIVKITRQIWKEKDIGLIYDTYSTG